MTVRGYILSSTCVNTINSFENSGILSRIKILLDQNRLGDLLIHRGYISPEELNRSLQLQSYTNQPLGKILIDTGVISKFQLFNLLMGQKVLRLSAAIFLYGASLTAVSKKSHAGTIKDVPARIMLASLDHTFEDLQEHPSLFGASEKKSTNLKAFTKWSDMFKRFDASLNTQKGQSIAQSLKKQISGLKESSIYETAKNVNSFMNQKKYIVDNKNWGKSDYWATPIEFMQRGGDCEDFAIAKYTALRALGVPENRMRVVIVRDQKKNMAHAVLTVYTERGPMILDNQIKTMKSANSISHYKPIFSINREAWWLHTTPQSDTSTVIASAE